MILYRPVGLQELERIYDSGMKAFPARLPQQPIFYPVLQLEYARQIASDWNIKSGQLAGYVIQFKVEEEYLGQFEEHTVGESQHQELWIPAEEMEEFNRHITGHIQVLEAYFGDAFQGFVPEGFGLQGMDAVEQFTLLANSYIYKRMDFYLEIKRNHKAVFLNYPFWQQYEFKNQGLKGKVLQAIKEAWLTSFPQIPLPLPPPVREDTPPVKQTDLPSSAVAVQEDLTPAEQTDAQAYSLGTPQEEDSQLIQQTDPDPLVHTVHEETTPPVEQSDSHFSRGVEWGLRSRYREAIDELSRAVEEDPEHVVAHTSLGVAFHRVGEDERALSCYESALRVDPIHADAHYFRANLLYSQGNIREAIAGYTVAIGLEPELIEAHQKPAPPDRLTDYSPSPAEMYWIARPAHRILDLNESLETNPGQASLFKERAAEYSRLGNYVQAIADYSSVLEIQPDEASVLHLRGVAHEQIGRFDRALEDYQRAIAIHPQLSDVYIDRGVTFGKTGNLRQSIASFTDAIRLAPKNPDGYFNRGTAYLQQGDFERAIEDFSNTIRLSPGDEEAYYWRGISNEAAGQPRQAITDYRQFLALSQNPQAREEVEQKLSQWNAGKPDSAGNRSDVPEDRQKTGQVQSERPDRDLDLYDLIVAIGERAQRSVWLGNGVECYGEGAGELSSFTGQNLPIEGHDFLRITSEIRQTIKGDFTGFDPGAASHWIFIRAWDGSGFYIETNDPKIREQLKSHFQSVEDVEGAEPPYEALFIRT